ncbi:MAG: hypothetical protein ABW056_13390 [Thermoanaerobaculia bacterium]
MNPVVVDLDGGYIRPARDSSDVAIGIPLDDHFCAASGERSGESGQGENPTEGG